MTPTDARRETMSETTQIKDVEAFAFDLALDLWNRVCCHGKQPDGAYMGRVENCVAEAIAEHGER